MLRNILIAIGLLVAVDPYLGFPASIDKFILTTLGLLMVFLLILSRRNRVHREVREEVVTSNPKVLHVERTEVEDSPRMHVERSIIEDTESIENKAGEDIVVEKKTSVVRRRRIKKPESVFPAEMSE